MKARGGLLVRSVRYRTFWQFPHQIALFGNYRPKSHFLVISASNRTFEQFPRQFALFTTYGTFSHPFIFLKKTIFCTFSHNNVRGLDANRQKAASVRLRAAEGHNFASAEFFQNPQNPFKIPTSSQSRVTDVSRDPLCQSRTGSVVTCTGARDPPPCVT